MRKFRWVVPGVLFLAACAEEIRVPEDLAAARAFFDKARLLGEAYDPAFVDLYADSAKIRMTTNTAAGGVRELQLTGTRFKDGLLRSMRSGTRGPGSRFSNISVHREAKGVRVAAIRYSEADCQVDEVYSIVVAPTADGTWKIFEESRQGWEVSACPGANAPKPLAERLRAIAASLSPILPWEISSEARLDRVTVDETRLVYTFTLSAQDVSAESVTREQRPQLERDNCSKLEERTIVAEGGSLVFEYLDVQGRAITRIVVDHCPAPRGAAVHRSD